MTKFEKWRISISLEKTWEMFCEAECDSCPARKGCAHDKEYRKTGRAFCPVCCRAQFMKWANGEAKE
jgi:hypothetical protein